ncbi:putative ctr copper transporter family protein [Lyophyllum shimeji]|uniref:Copper transport protein n=1 Tax=Lyophyllum shimeji TaxID=47721 RepID=A0A9P3Q164_LYOSH|nr:putative ctr copper transporter family protein [Lyophyllum shimeji]
MDMSHGNSTMPAEHACKISMLWNWHTIDACFLSEQWHIRSVGGYVGTIIGVFMLVVVLELFRRLGREYDRKIVRDHARSISVSTGSARDDASINKLSDGGEPRRAAVTPFRPTVAQQAVRSAFYFVQFSAGYILMLLAMYYNGGLILAIFFGSYVGFFVSSWDTVGELTTPEARGQCCC